MSEIYYSGDTSRTMYDINSAEASDVFLQVKELFPWARLEDYFSISSPVMHGVLNDTVVTCCFPAQMTTALVGPGYALGNRKFCIESKTSFLRLYKLFDEQAPAWMPASAKILFTTENHAEFGRPAPDGIDSFYDLYFQGDPQEVEQHFNLPEKRGAYDTFYGVTVVNGQPARVKQYVYDAQAGFSDWDVVYLMQCKRQGRLDLLNG